MVTSCAKPTCCRRKLASPPRLSRQPSITEQTYFCWRKEYGGLTVDQAKRLKDLETDNARLRRALSDAVIDNQILS